MDFDSIVYLLVGLTRMSWGAAIFFSVVAWCLFFLTNRAIDIALCAVKTVGRWFQTVGYAIGDALFSGVEEEVEPEPQPKRSRNRQ